jgi:hypothetical protein
LSEARGVADGTSAARAFSPRKSWKSVSWLACLNVAPVQVLTKPRHDLPATELDTPAGDSFYSFLEHPRSQLAALNRVGRGESVSKKGGEQPWTTCFKRSRAEEDFGATHVDRTTFLDRCSRLQCCSPGATCLSVNAYGRMESRSIPPRIGRYGHKALFGMEIRRIRQAEKKYVPIGAYPRPPFWGFSGISPESVWTDRCGKGVKSRAKTVRTSLQ